MFFISFNTEVLSHKYGVENSINTQRANVDTFCCITVYIKFKKIKQSIRV